MKIAITGVGIVSALGVGVESNREKLVAHTSEVHAAEVLPTCHHEWPVGEVGLTNRQLCFLTGQDVSAPISRNALLAMLAAGEAVRDAALSDAELAEMLLVNGTTVGGMDLTETVYAEWQKGDDRHLNMIAQHEAGMTAAYLQQYLGLADSTTISTACSSALNAMIHGANVLRIGAKKRVLVGGAEALTRFHLNGFAALGILSQQVCRPFQENRDGINLGEGAAYLVLEDAAEAIARGAKIYGYLSGYANRCDAYHQTASSPEGDGAFDAMCVALQMAGVASADVEYINAHGTATPNNDASELRAIERLFADKLPVIESTKSLTGHTTSASGSIEAIFCLLLMQEKGYKTVMSNAFGFGGNDSSIVLTATPHDIIRLDSGKSLACTQVFEANADADWKPYIPAMQARRMTPVMRRLVIAARQALEAAGVDVPDGIIVGTQWGGMIPSAQLLAQLVENGEQDMSPALFMQSTHNSAAGTLARLLNCKGYNATFSHGRNSLTEAMADASLQLMLGEQKNILVCAFDEKAEGWQEYLERASMPAEDVAKAMIMTLQ